MLLRHVCETCLKEEVLTPEQAFNLGWDYPPTMTKFQVVSPRTCGSCSITGRIWRFLNIEGK